jgi:hypothetical protein
MEPIRKYEAAEELIQLCADALRLRHPQGRSFRQLRATDLMTWPDERLVNAITTMRTWIAEQPPLTPGQG